MEPLYHPETPPGKRCSSSLTTCRPLFHLTEFWGTVWWGGQAPFSEWVSDYSTGLKWSHLLPSKVSVEPRLSCQVATRVRSICRISSAPAVLVWRPHSLDYWSFSVSLRPEHQLHSEHPPCINIMLSFHLRLNFSKRTHWQASKFHFIEKKTEPQRRT